MQTYLLSRLRPERLQCKMPLYGENDDSDDSDGSTSSGATRLGENQMLAESQPSDVRDFLVINYEEGPTANNR